jgi:peptidoglycan/xylan/chitin deacetylase (PgdA/CDA1 family)
MHDRLYELTPETFGRDVDASLAALTRCGVQAVVGFRAPEWSINERSLWALDVLASRGIRLDSSMAPMRVVGDPNYRQDIHRQGTNYGEIIECPPAVGRVFGANVPLGGGWGLRARRPRAVLRSLDRRLGAGRPAVVWIHPWEIDEDPPQVKLPASLHFAHYFGLAGFRHRLESILRGASFGPLSEVARMSTTK